MAILDLDFLVPCRKNSVLKFLQFKVKSFNDFSKVLYLRSNKKLRASKTFNQEFHKKTES